jgi:hypothetical protein
VKELEAEYYENVTKLKHMEAQFDMQKRLAIYYEMRDDYARLARRMDLVVAKKYQLSKKIVYGIENEIHLVE